jgi:hypothetical protein
MGLFHTADAALSKGVGNFERGEQSAKRAEFCFRVARDIDNRTSRAKIRAQEILKSKGSGFLSPTRV